MRNEILKEVWRARDAFARRHHYDIDAMVAELKQVEAKSAQPIVDRSKRTSRRRAGRKARPTR